MLNLICPFCKTSFQASPELVGKDAACPSCRQPVPVPRPQVADYRDQRPPSSLPTIPVQPKRRPIRPDPDRRSEHGDDPPTPEPGGSLRSAGILLIVGGCVAASMFLFASLQIYINASQMSRIQSVGGVSINEAFYQSSGAVWAGIGTALDAMAVFVLFVSLGLGKWLLHLAKVENQRREWSKS